MPKHAKSRSAASISGKTKSSLHHKKPYERVPLVDEECSIVPGSFIAAFKSDVPHATQYQLLIDRVKLTPLFGLVKANIDKRQPEITGEINEQFSLLGNVSEDRASIFDRSEASIRCAREFLSHFFASEENQRLVIESHSEKMRDKKREAEFPSCASFVTATLYGKKCCFVACSKNAYADRMAPALEHTIKELNKTQECEFVLMDSIESNNMSVAVKALCSMLGDTEYSVTKKCSELLAVIVLKELLGSTGHICELKEWKLACYIPIQLEKNIVFVRLFIVMSHSLSLCLRTTRELIWGMDYILLQFLVAKTVESASFPVC